MVDSWVVDLSRTTSRPQSTAFSAATSPTYPSVNIAQSSHPNTSLSNSALGGVIAASIIVVFVLIGILWFLGRRQRRSRAAKAIDTEGSYGSLRTGAQGMSREDTSSNIPIGDDMAESEPRGRDPTPKPLTMSFENQVEQTGTACQQSPEPDARKSGREPRFSEEYDATISQVNHCVNLGRRF
ncbi:hypothetical protein CKAH01_13607 [Colletotrichum kahawae]|uniref:Uncharacterized protein n=1 Tax=Colletotrichum kahawae TaxID=34407 RepID=A0AAD9YN68_COLKA|nr:hypothetical protein CKAH01_13607 [Colletotrichum kahawae]